MKPDGISTLNVSNMMRSTTRSGQVALLRAQTELSTGRHADVGLALGSLVSRNINWRTEVQRLEAQKNTNGLTAAQANVTQTSLQSIKDIADGFVATLAGLRTAQNGQTLAKEAAETALGSLKEALNVTFNGKYIFAGQNADQAPLSDYAGGASEGAINTAFATEFGFPQSDPATKFITPSQMQTFLQNTFKDQFKDPNWQTNWSNADSTNMLSRIDSHQRLNIAGNANAEPIRQLVESLTSVIGSGSPNLSTATFQSLVDNAMSVAATSVRGISDEQARVGLGQGELRKAGETNSRKLEILKGQISDTEGVDNYDAAMRVNSLMSQLEASYTLTGKISKLSLVNFI